MKQLMKDVEIVQRWDNLHDPLNNKGELPQRYAQIWSIWII